MRCHDHHCTKEDLIPVVVRSSHTFAFLAVSEDGGLCRLGLEPHPRNEAWSKAARGCKALELACFASAFLCCLHETRTATARHTHLKAFRAQGRLTVCFCFGRWSRKFMFCGHAMLQILGFGGPARFQPLCSCVHFRLQTRIEELRLFRCQDNFLFNNYVPFPTTKTFVVGGLGF